MKVIEEGKAPAYRTRCKVCHSLLEYTSSDIEVRFGGVYSEDQICGGVITCPVCSSRFAACGERVIEEQSPKSTHKAVVPASEPEEYSPF